VEEEGRRGREVCAAVGREETDGERRAKAG
jgi:hypothetical protein